MASSAADTYLETLFAEYLPPASASSSANNNIASRLSRVYRHRLATRIIPAIVLLVAPDSDGGPDTEEHWREFYAQGVSIDVAARVPVLRATGYSLAEIGSLVYMLHRSATRDSSSPVEDALRLLCALEPREFVGKVMAALSRHGAQITAFQASAELRDMTHVSYVRQFIVPLIDPVIPERTRLAREIIRLFQLFEDPAVPPVPERQARADEIVTLFQGFAFVVSGSAH